MSLSKAVVKMPEGFTGIALDEAGHLFFYSEGFLRWACATYILCDLNKKETYHRALEKSYFTLNEHEAQANKRILCFIEGVYWEDDEQLAHFPREAIQSLHGYLCEGLRKGCVDPNRCRWN